MLLILFQFLYQKMHFRARIMSSIVIVRILLTELTSTVFGQLLISNSSKNVVEISIAFFIPIFLITFVMSNGITEFNDIVFSTKSSIGMFKMQIIPQPPSLWLLSPQTKLMYRELELYHLHEH